MLKGDGGPIVAQKKRKRERESGGEEEGEEDGEEGREEGREKRGTVKERIDWWLVRGAPRAPFFKGNKS